MQIYSQNSEYRGTQTARFGRVLSFHDPDSATDVPPCSHTAAGFSTVQALMAMTIVMIAGLASVEALILTNHKAAVMRTVNNARAVVQQNIDTALGVPFGANDPVPAILATGTSASTVPIVLARDGTTSVVNGTLTRTVSAEPNPSGANIRRVTFQAAYTYRSRPYSVSMTTLRSTD